jgi:hypothetical protein
MSWSYLIWATGGDLLPENWVRIVAFENRIVDFVTTPGKEEKREPATATIAVTPKRLAGNYSVGDVHSRGRVSLVDVCPTQTSIARILRCVR